MRRRTSKEKDWDPDEKVLVVNPSLLYKKIVGVL